MYDMDDKGYITWQDIQNALQSDLKEEELVKAVQIKAMIEKINPGGNGTIPKDIFIKF